MAYSSVTRLLGQRHMRRTHHREQSRAHTTGELIGHTNRLADTTDVV